MKKTALEWKKIYSSPDFHREYLYEGKLGFFYENMENVFRESVFRIWSPFAEGVMIDFTGTGAKETLLRFMR